MTSISGVRFRVFSRRNKNDFVDKAALFRGLVPTKQLNGVVIKLPPKQPALYDVLGTTCLG
jgi:hypothetical protein